MVAPSRRRLSTKRKQGTDQKSDLQAGRRRQVRRRRYRSGVEEELGSDLEEEMARPVEHNHAYGSGRMMGGDERRCRTGVSRCSLSPVAAKEIGRRR
ncbi:hypothetical protein ZWY2020_037351 [Hordeum vulgare]|nr:hypothetical protein ZWY2020_028698 [Hordeum vulgare]KAI5016973.1 hypothetical protein ZWY2020_037351 [Hordeum vulgare]